MNFNPFPKTGAALETNPRNPPKENEFEGVDVVWDKYIAHADHGDTLNLTDTILEPTLQQLDLLLARIGGGLRRITLSGVFSRMFDTNHYISEVFKIVSTHCCLGNLEELTLSRLWNRSTVNTKTMKQWIASSKFCSGIRRLDFSGVSFQESVTFADFISKCPKLESLALANSSFRFCGGRLVPLPLDEMMPNLRKLDLDNICFCIGDKKLEADVLSFPCDKCDPNRREKYYNDIDDIYSYRRATDDDDAVILDCCLPHDRCNKGNYEKRRKYLASMKKKLREEEYKVFSEMMNALPNLEYLDISKIRIWEHIKKFLLESNRKIQTVRYVDDSEPYRINEFIERRDIMLKNVDRKHASDCYQVAIYEDYPANKFWADFPANVFIRDATFEDVLERIKNGQHPGIRTPVTIKHAFWYLESQKNNLMTLFEAAREAWRKYGFSRPIHKFYNTLIFLIITEVEYYENEGFTREILENAIKEVANYPPAKDLGLISMLQSFYHLSRDYHDSVSKDTLVAIIAALEHSNSADIVTQDDVDNLQFLKRKFGISKCKLVSNKRFIPHQSRSRVQGLGLTLPASKRQRQ